MTSLAAYNTFLEEVNRNDSNSNIFVSRGKFVNIYNKEAKRWQKEKFKRKLSSDELEELSNLLVDSLELQKIKSHKDHFDFKLPEDYYNLASSYSEAKKENCIRTLDNWKTKPQNIRTIFKDPNNSPSFEFEETPIVVGNNILKVYFTDFVVEKVFIDYYKYPIDIDLEGYIKIDGTASSNIHPDLPDLAVNEIISRCSAEIMRRTENANGIQMAKDRINTEE